MPDLTDAINVLRNRTDSHAADDGPDAEMTAIWEAIMMLADAICSPAELMVPAPE